MLTVRVNEYIFESRIINDALKTKKACLNISVFLMYCHSGSANFRRLRFGPVLEVKLGTVVSLPVAPLHV